MSNTPCPFCGSKEIRQQTDEMTPVSWGANGPVYEHVTRYCCKSQEVNAKYQQKHYSEHQGPVPSTEDIGKWQK